MIHYYYASLKVETIQKLSKFKKGCWVDASLVTDKEKEVLNKELKIDDGLLNDALDIHEVPRFETGRDGQFYFFARTPVENINQDELPTSPILIVIDQDSVLTISRKNLNRLWNPLLKDTSVATTQKTKLFILMVNQITSSYRNNVNLIGKKVRMASSSIHHVSQKKISELIEFERELDDYLDSLNPMNEALESMLNGRSIKLYEEDREILEDLSLSFEQLIMRCKSMIRSITNIRDNYRIILDSRLNDTIKTLTVITVALTIPTMLAGIYGMNLRLPGDVNNPYYFWFIVILSLASSLALGLYFSKKK
jgi:magnesium transporter